MRLVGDYSLGPLLGRGGTGEVYAAEYVGAEATTRVWRPAEARAAPAGPLAVKLLRPELAVDAAMVDAFVGEATRTRDIAHPNIVRVLDFGTDADTGRCYLVMARLAGESLAARIARIGALPEATVRSIGAQIADGMQAAHDRGIVHRDLKPGNVMLDGDTPTVIDFGVAKSLGAGSAVVTSRRVGTLAYMAPEQLAQGLITPAVDIWALGAILYEAATGRAPFGNFAEGRLPQLVETPVSPSTIAPISAELSSLILACLERSPGRRPAAMADIARRLAGGAGERVTVDAGPVAVDLPPDLAPMQSRARRPRWVWIATGAAIAAVATMLGVLAMSGANEVAPAALPAMSGANEAAPAALPAMSSRPAAIEQAVVVDAPPVVVDAVEPITAKPPTNKPAAKRRRSTKAVQREPLKPPPPPREEGLD